MKLALWLLSISAVGWGQDLKVSPAGAAPGGPVQVEVSIESPAGKAPVALQWDIIFPSQLLDLEGDGPDLSQMDKELGKSIACAMHKPYSYTCILFGGQMPLKNGSIGTFRFKVRSDARLGPTAIRVQKVQAVGGDFKQTPLKDAEGTVTIR